MTDSDAIQDLGVWKKLPDAQVEACDIGGRVRTVDRVKNGRRLQGKELTPKKSGTSPYWEVKYTDDEDRVRTVPVHVVVLRAHRGECPPGMQGCHDDDDKNNNNLWNLWWKPPRDNVFDRLDNHPPAPRPAKECVRCGEEFTGNGRRCHPCVVTIGVQAAGLLRSGVTLERAAVYLEYPSAPGLHTLAVKYGGYGQSRSRRVRKRLGRWLAGGDAQ